MVADFLSSDWKLALWLLYLVLNELSMTPMYSAVSSVALYTTDSVRHLFCTGQAVLFLQEHSFSLVGSRLREYFLLVTKVDCLKCIMSLHFTPRRRGSAASNI